MAEFLNKRHVGWIKFCLTLSQVRVSCKRLNEILASVKGLERLDQLHDY